MCCFCFFIKFKSSYLFCFFLYSKLPLPQRYFFLGGRGLPPQGFQKKFQRKLCRKLFCAKSECFDMFLMLVVISIVQLEVIQTNEKYPFHMSMANPKKFSPLFTSQTNFLCFSIVVFVYMIYVNLNNHAWTKTESLLGKIWCLR